MSNKPKREPAIHAKVSDVVATLEELGIPQPDSIGWALASRLRGKALTHRTQVNVKASGRKKAEKTQVLNAAEVEQFQQVLTAVRQIANHRKARQPQPGTREHANLVNAAEAAHSYAAEFYPDDRRQGLVSYWRFGRTRTLM